jgi:adenylosuccinate synthase
MTKMKALIENRGIHAIVDGQFGSTGKGTFAYWLAKQIAANNVYCEGTIYSGGPNSGHTFYHEGEKHVNKQLPTIPVALSLITNRIQAAYLSAGAVINPAELFSEAHRYYKVQIFVHPNAAVILPGDQAAESVGSVAEVAGTRSGTGVAIAGKVLREPNRIWRNFDKAGMPPNVVTLNHRIKPEDRAYFMEVAQGFSLGINQPFYPKVTSRECTVAQGMADAGLSPYHLKRVYMCIRTFPIRVANVDGYSSGDWYPDQRETSWEELGQEPEITTVTKRIRRVATFSQNQMDDALYANHPDFVFVNFLNYLSLEAQKEFLDDLKTNRPFGVQPFSVIEGRGPGYEDITAPADLQTIQYHNAGSAASAGDI